jgi:hypothetical protein
MKDDSDHDQHGCRLKKLEKFFDRKTGLLDDGLQGSTLEVSIVESDGHAKSWPIRMFENE